MYLANRGTATVSKASQADRLSEQIRVSREKAGQLPAGSDRDELLRKIEQDEAALRVIQWVTSSDHLPPPLDLIPMKRHKLRRK
jgi:hypothetical protein